MLFAGSKLNRSAREEVGKQEKVVRDICVHEESLLLPFVGGKVLLSGSCVLSVTVAELHAASICLLGDVDPQKSAVEAHVVLGKTMDTDRWIVAANLSEEQGEKLVKSLTEAGDITDAPERRTVRQLLHVPGIAFRHSGSGDANGTLEHCMSVIGQGFALLHWRGNNKFCARCGGSTKPIEGGVKVACQTCQRRAYPRLDPVVISIVYSQDRQRCLLGRQKSFPKGMYTLLSGFVDQGESIEEAAMREVKEESGVIVEKSSVRVTASQPWPVGRGNSSQLMIGCSAVAADETVVVNEEEMEDCRWFTLQELREAAGRTREVVFSESDEKEGEVQLWIPPSYALANHLIQDAISSSL